MNSVELKINRFWNFCFALLFFVSQLTNFYFYIATTLYFSWAVWDFRVRFWERFFSLLTPIISPVSVDTNRCFTNHFNSDPLYSKSGPSFPGFRAQSHKTVLTSDGSHSVASQVVHTLVRISYKTGGSHNPYPQVWWFSRETELWKAFYSLLSFIIKNKPGEQPSGKVHWAKYSLFK